jgi:hypothetical protein
MKKLLSLMFASMVVIGLTMPAFASGLGANDSTASTAKTQKAKSTKTHKSTKTSEASKPNSTATPSAPKTK